MNAVSQRPQIPTRPLVAGVSGGLVALGAAVAFNFPVLVAGLFGAVAAGASLSRARVVRIASWIIAAMAGALFAVFAALLNAPSFLLSIASAISALLIWWFAWREAMSPPAASVDRSVAVVFTAIGLFVLFRALAQVGGEFSHCWLPGVPLGCNP
jgi:hypothetical protein